MIVFANPFLKCDVCQIPVARTNRQDRNYPCGHLGTTSECLSWGPADGCQCPVPQRLRHRRSR